MRWRRGDEYYIQSDAGYRVCKGHVHGAWWYLAYSPARKILGERHSASDQAKHACEEHARIHSSKHAA